MNERIKSLLNVCGMPNEDLMEIYSDVNKSFYMEKFAELLIRDVTETATKYRQSKTRPVGWNFRHTVLDHYGLKENDSPRK